MCICYMPGIVLGTRDIGTFLLLVLSDSPAQNGYNQLTPSYMVMVRQGL